MVVTNRASMKRTGMDSTTTTISGKKFGEGGMEIIRNEGGDNILFTIRNDKEVVSAGGSKVVLPSWTGEDTRLGAVGTGSLSFGVDFHSFYFYLLCLSLLVQDYSQW